MTIYRKSDENDEESAVSGAETPSEDETTQSIPPIADPVLITPEDKERHNHSLSENPTAEGQHLEETQAFNPLLDDFDDAGNAAGGTGARGTSEVGNQETARLGAANPQNAINPEDKPSVLPNPDFATSTLIFPQTAPVAQETTLTGTREEESSPDAGETTEQISPAVLGDNSALKDEGLPTTAITSRDDYTSISSNEDSAADNESEYRDDSGDKATTSYPVATANTPNDELNSTLEQFVSDFGEDTTDSRSDFGAAGTRGTSDSQELGAGGVSVAERKDDENQRRLIIATVVALVAIILTFALIYGGLAVRRAMRTSEYNNALSNCESSTSKMQKAGKALGTQLTEAQSVTSSVTADDVSDSGTVTRLQNAISSGKSTSNNISSIDSCSSTLTQARLEEITQLSTNLTKQAHKNTSSIKTSIGEVRKSAAAKEKSDAKDDLQAVAAQGQTLYATTKGQVQDDQTRVDLNNELKKATALLDKKEKEVTTQEYTDETQAVKNAMTSVTNSKNAKIAADKAAAEEKARQDALKKQQEEDARRRAEQQKQDDQNNQNQDDDDNSDDDGSDNGNSDNNNNSNSNSGNNSGNNSDSTNNKSNSN